MLGRSAVKSMVAGVAGAALTNPLDVVRNEMFKTDLSVVEVRGVACPLCVVRARLSCIPPPCVTRRIRPCVQVVKKLYREEGLGFCSRGIQKNMVAVAVPIAITIFATDFLVRTKPH